MTIDEAIEHCENVARDKLESSSQVCVRCGKEHRQLAMWLKELKEYKKWLKIVRNSEELIHK